MESLVIAVPVSQLMLGKSKSLQTKIWSNLALLARWRDFLNSFTVSSVESSGRYKTATKSLRLELGRISQNKASVLFSKSVRLIQLILLLTASKTPPPGRETQSCLWIVKSKPGSNSQSKLFALSHVSVTAIKSMSEARTWPHPVSVQDF